MSTQFWIAFVVFSLLSFSILFLIMECRLLRSIAQQNRDRMNHYLTRLRIAEDKLRLED